MKTVVPVVVQLAVECFGASEIVGYRPVAGPSGICSETIKRLKARSRCDFIDRILVIVLETCGGPTGAPRYPALS